jgi:hypothetical protein
MGLLLVPGAAQAQFSLGVQGNWADDFDFGVGARAAYSLQQINQPVVIFGTFDWFFPSQPAVGDFNYYEFNLNAAYIASIRMDLDTWVGLGLNVAFTELKNTALPDASESRAGLNLLAGAKYKFGKAFGVFGEARFEVEGGEQFVLTGGLDYTFGR